MSWMALVLTSVEVRLWRRAALYVLRVARLLPREVLLPDYVVAVRVVLREEDTQSVNYLQVRAEAQGIAHDA